MTEWILLYIYIFFFLVCMINLLIRQGKIDLGFWKTENTILRELGSTQMEQNWNKKKSTAEHELCAAT